MNSQTCFTPGTPAADGWRMPAEWAPSSRHLADLAATGRHQLSRQVRDRAPVYAAFIRLLVAVEEVNINVWHAEMEDWVRGPC
jgi:agmatine/peptidylarginine deiminase